MGDGGGRIEVVGKGSKERMSRGYKYVIVLVPVFK